MSKSIKELKEELQRFRDEAKGRKKQEERRIDNSWLYSRIGLLLVIVLPISLYLFEGYSWAYTVSYWFYGWAGVGLVWFICFFIDAGKEHHKLWKERYETTIEEVEEYEQKSKNKGGD